MNAWESRGDYAPPRVARRVESSPEIVTEDEWYASAMELVYGSPRCTEAPKRRRRTAKPTRVANWPQSAMFPTY
jgi:hypothetical protein